MTDIETSQDLRRSLDKRDAAFERLLSLIPARYYIVDTPEEVSADERLDERLDRFWYWSHDPLPLPDQADSKWMKNKKKRSAEEVTETRKKAKFEKVSIDRKLNRIVISD
jgi:hypothetical protein